MKLLRVLIFLLPMMLQTRVHAQQTLAPTLPTGAGAQDCAPTLVVGTVYNHQSKAMKGKKVCTFQLRLEDVMPPYDCGSMDLDQEALDGSVIIDSACDLKDGEHVSGGVSVDQDQNLVFQED